MTPLYFDLKQSVVGVNLIQRKDQQLVANIQHPARATRQTLLQQVQAVQSVYGGWSIECTPPAPHNWLLTRKTRQLTCSTPGFLLQLLLHFGKGKGGSLTCSVLPVKVIMYMLLIASLKQRGLRHADLQIVAIEFSSTQRRQRLKYGALKPVLCVTPQYRQHIAAATQSQI